MGVGVLLTGGSDCGKSELALELITRGHQLVADDAPVFTLTPAGSIQGGCPDVLRNYLHVRALGLLDIEMLYGNQALCSQTSLDLIVELEHGILCNSALDGPVPRSRQILNVEIRTMALAAASGGRSPAVLVECLARLYLARARGHSAIRDFCLRHTQIMHYSVRS